MLATSEAPELKSLADLGVKGQLPVLINSFKVGANEPPAVKPPVVEPPVVEPPHEEPPVAPPVTSDGNAKAAEHYDRAVQLAEKDDLDGAIAELTAVIKLDPNNAVGYVARGNLRYEKQDFKGAASDYTLALIADPESVVAYLRRRHQM